MRLVRAILDAARIDDFVHDRIRVPFAELLHRQNMLVLERTADRVFRPIGWSRRG